MQLSSSQSIKDQVTKKFMPNIIWLLLEIDLLINTVQHTNLTAFVPEALVAAMPQSEASAPGSAKVKENAKNFRVNKLD